EGAVRPRQLFGRSVAEIGPGHPGLAGFEHRRRVDAGDVLGADAARQLLGQDARAAAHVEHVLPGIDAAVVRKDGRKLGRPAAQEAVVGITRDLEANPGYSRSGAGSRKLRSAGSGACWWQRWGTEVRDQGGGPPPRVHSPP